MRFAFAGGKPQGLAILEALRADGHVPQRVFVPRGLPDADRAALERFGAPLEGPGPIDPDRLDGLDLLILCRFELIPEAVFTRPRLGAINVHSSLLPKYRGVHPVSWALVDGAERTGVTVHRIDAGVDTGAIVAQEAIAIRESHDLHSLTADLDRLSASAVRDVVRVVVATGRLPPARPQVGLPTPARRRRPEDGRIDWTGSARNVVNLVRALPPPLPPAFTFVREHRLEVKRCAVTVASLRGAPGTVIDVRGDTAAVRCGDGAVVLFGAEGLRVGDVCR